MSLYKSEANKKPNMQDFTDLMLRAKKGDSLAFEQIYNEYITPIHRYVYYRVHHREDVDDLVQVVFLKVFESLPRWRPKQKPLAYIYTIARNTVIDHWRKKGRELPQDDITELNISTDEHHVMSENIDSQNQIGQIMSVTKHLSQDYQDVLTLRFINDLSTKEIAKLLNKNEASIRQIQSRGLKKIKELLQEL